MGNILSISQKRDHLEEEEGHPPSSIELDVINKKTAAVTAAAASQSAVVTAQQQEEDVVVVSWSGSTRQIDIDNTNHNSVQRKPRTSRGQRQRRLVTKIPFRFRLCSRPRSNSSPGRLLTSPPPETQCRTRTRSYSQTLLENYAGAYQPIFSERLEFLRGLFVEALAELLPLKMRIERCQGVADVLLEVLRHNGDESSRRYRRDAKEWDLLDREIVLLKAWRGGLVFGLMLKVQNELEVVEDGGVVRFGGRKRSESCPLAVDLAVLRRRLV